MKFDAPPRRENRVIGPTPLIVRHGTGARSASPGQSAREGRFVRDRSGVSVIEFAMLLPLFLGVMFMIAQIGLYFYTSASLYYATAKAARQVMTGSVANQSLTADQFRNNVLCPLLPGSMPCSSIVTNVQVVPAGNYGAGWTALTNANGLNTPPMDNSKTSFCIGSGGSLVALQVYYAMPVLGIPQMLPGATTFNGQSVVFIDATAAWKNEPFTTSYAGC